MALRLLRTAPILTVFTAIAYVILIAAIFLHTGEITTPANPSPTATPTNK